VSSYSLPRLKSSVEFCTLDNIIYFLSRPGVAIEMVDASGFISKVCKLMDGEKDIDQLKQSLLPEFPNETPYLESLLTALDNEYLLEDVSRNYPDNLTSYDTARWSRNIEFFASYCKAADNKYSHQAKLKSTKVAVLGLGGVGSNILYNLVAMGVCNIKAVDFDQVELSNLNRQIIYNESDVGKLKSVAAEERISQFLPNANIEFINKKITCSEDIEEIIVGQDIVISAIDQPREKVMDWFNMASVKHGIPFICGALDSRVAICYTVFPGKTGCMECWKDNASKSAMLFNNLIQHENFTPSLSPNVAIMPFISIVSGLVTNELLKIITGIAEPQSLGQLCTYDFATSQITISESWKKNPACPVCQKKG
jgi:molybdopterin/thiamine biosynthesis adenylyltransferase